MDDFQVTERTYSKDNSGKIQTVHTTTNCKNLAEAVNQAITRLEQLMQKELYNPQEPLDLAAL